MRYFGHREDEGAMVDGVGVSKTGEFPAAGEAL